MARVRPSSKATFLRNSTRLWNFDKSEPESSGAPLKVLDGPTLVAFLIIASAGIGICQAESKCTVEEDRELSGRGRHGLCFSRTRGKAPVEGAECRLGLARVDGGDPHDRRVFELSTRPPEILLPGANVNHDVKCFAVGHFFISSPHSATKRSTV